MNRLGRIAVVSLDATGTLIKVKNSTGYHYNKVFQRYGLKFDEDRLTSNFFRCFKKQSKHSPSFGSSHLQKVKSEEAWWTELIKSIIVRSTVETHSADPAQRDRQLELINSLPPTAYSELYHRFEGDLTHFSSTKGTVKDAIHECWELYPEVKDTLDYLRDSKRMLTIISNFDERIHTILRLLGIYDYFKTSDGARTLITTSIDTGYSKPHPAIFQSHLDLIRQVDPSITKEQVLYVGDSVDKDLEAAASFGFQSLLLDRKNDHNDVPKQSKISTLADLRALLD